MWRGYHAGLIVLACGCGNDPMLGLFDSLATIHGPFSDWSWARHTKTGANIYYRSSGETMHCSDVSGFDDPPTIELSKAALSARGAGVVVAAPLDPSQAQAIVDFVEPPRFPGPYDVGTFELDSIGATLTGSVDATLATGVTTPCCLLAKCTCWTVNFHETPFCE